MPGLLLWWERKRKQTSKMSEHWLLPFYELCYPAQARHVLLFASMLPCGACGVSELGETNNDRSCHNQYPGATYQQQKLLQTYG